MTALGNHPTPRTTAALFLVLAISPELKFRIRDSAAAFTGSFDTQILFELALWAVVGCWVGWFFTRGLASRDYRPASLNAPVVVLVLVMCVVLVSAAHALSIRAHTPSEQG